MGVAKTMITEIFLKKAALIVTSTFTTWYVMLISIFNMAGRIVWASASDYIGRKNTYYCFFILGIILYSSIPISAQTFDIAPVVVWLILFYGATLIIFTMYGGGFATIPAYLADMFGNDSTFPVITSNYFIHLWDDSGSNVNKIREINCSTIRRTYQLCGKALSFMINSLHNLR